ncbi:putative metalloprotease CJM1_0395 family protein [Shewanella mangrovisoli]|uniref:putative metalloprotease CJM1_0395 family protein n=1 Tax=Shewanella mangrovisoli TaxID=2864211 RepID=UPI001C65835F|nr:putative metalloprotease CJM1_0395 family protein [Shewanella mangrovisoli]QYK10948.1 catalase [Shewanella mangrovisoli]
MSVMALSSQIGAPSTSFLGADKSIESSKGGKPQGGQTYQGGNGQAVATLSASTVNLNPAKFEASGALAPSLSSLGAAMGQAVPMSTTPPTLLTDIKPASPHVSSNVDSVSVQKAFTSLGENAAAQLNSKQLHSNKPLSQALQSNQPHSAPLDTSLLASSNSSFSLLTGPRSIGGMREGQIAAISTQPSVSTLSASDVGFSATSGAVTPFSPPAPSLAATIATTSSSVGSASLGVANIFSTSTPVGANIGPTESNGILPNASSAVVSPFATEFAEADAAGKASHSSASAFANSNAIPDSKQSSGLSEQLSRIFSEPSGESGQVGAGITPNAQTQQQQTQTEQIQAQDARDEQAKQARTQAIQEQEQKQQALAEVFAKADQTKQAQQAQDEQTRQQDLAKEQVKQAQEKAIEQQKAQVEALKSRDTEVKAHEHAHASVGGQYAQSPSFKYEKGADGQRYATDGEVQIDVSIVPGDPLATINKMKQVYAAAMAPVDPSSADIRVAAEALQKMNEAKTKLAEERQQQIVDQPTTETLIGAEAQIEGLPPLKERQIQVTGKIDANGNITAPQDEPSAPVTEVIDKIKQAIAAQVASSNTSDTASNAEVDTTETIEPPTATLAIGAVPNKDEAPEVAMQRLASPRDNKSGLSYTTNGSNAVRFYGSVAVATLASKGNAELNQSGSDDVSLERIDDSALTTHSPSNEGNSVISNELALESSSRQNTRGLFNPQTLALHRPRFLDVNV